VTRLISADMKIGQAETYLEDRHNSKPVTALDPQQSANQANIRRVLKAVEDQLEELDSNISRAGKRETPRR
jgi:transcription termination factor NusB